jgi:hypothetical protein
LYTEVLFKTAFGIALSIIAALEIVSAFLTPNLPVFIVAAILMILLLGEFSLGMQMRCRDTWILYNDLVVSQRNSLAQYVSSAMHSFNPPSYQLLLTESFYDQGKTLLTELARLLSTAREESRGEIAEDIQKQMIEWETILNQLRDRIDQLDTLHKL